MKKLYLIVFLFINIISKAQIPGWEWARGSGAVAPGAQSICTDASGNAYVVGSFTGPSISFGTHTLINNSLAGGSNIFIVKYDSSANVQWAISAGGTSSDAAQNISIDAAGDIYVSGYYSSQIFVLGTDTFINGLPGASNNFFLAKFDSHGDFYWSTNKGLSTTGTSQRISADASGNTFATGSFSTAYATWGNDTLHNPHGNTGNPCIYVAKYNLTGNVEWLRAVPGIATGGVDYGQSVGTDVFGNVYLTGYFVSDTIRFAHDTLTGSGFVLLKYNKYGTPVWAKKATGSGFTGENGQGISTDANGNIYVTGQFPGATMVFGNSTLLNVYSGSGGNEIYLVKYDTSGNVLWAQGAGSSGINASNRVSTDAAGNACVTGNFSSSSITFGNNTLSSTGGYPGGVFVVKYDASGNVVWAKSASGEGVGNSTGLSADGFDDVYISGYYTGAKFTFGATEVIASGGNTNFFIAKLGTHNIATGIVEAYNAATTVNVYPNPSSGKFNFAGIYPGSTIQIYNVLGEMVYSFIAASDKCVVRLNTEAKGVYFYRITGEGIASTVQQGKIILE